MVLRINEKARTKYDANFKQLQSISDRLSKLGDKVVGTSFKFNLKDVLDRGHESYKEQFFNEFSHLYPSVVNQTAQFNAVTNVRPSDVQAIVDEFKAVLRTFSPLRTPIITHKVKHVNKVWETFEQHLQEDKIEKYNAASKVVDAVNAYCKVNPNASNLVYNVRKLDTQAFLQGLGVGLELNINFFTNPN